MRCLGDALTLQLNDPPPILTQWYLNTQVDTGLEPLGEFSPRETHTKGMDDLLERCKGYYDQGARFAKWRAVIRIDEETNLPTRACIQLNSAELTRCVASSHRKLTTTSDVYRPLKPPSQPTGTQPCARPAGSCPSWSRRSSSKGATRPRRSRG